MFSELIRRPTVNRAANPSARGVPAVRETEVLTAPEAAGRDAADFMSSRGSAPMLPALIRKGGLAALTEAIVPSDREFSLKQKLAKKELNKPGNPPALPGRQSQFDIFGS